MSQASTGPALSEDQESDLRRTQTETALAEAEHAIEVIEAKLAGVQETLQARKDEAAQLRAELEG